MSKLDKKIGRAAVNVREPNFETVMVDVVNRQNVIQDMQQRTSVSGITYGRLFKCGGCDTFREFNVDSTYLQFIRMHGHSCAWTAQHARQLMKVPSMKSVGNRLIDVVKVMGTPKSLAAAIRVKITEDAVRMENDITDTNSVISELTSSVAEQATSIKGRLNC